MFLFPPCACETEDFFTLIFSQCMSSNDKCKKKRHSSESDAKNKGSFTVKCAGNTDGERGSEDLVLFQALEGQGTHKHKES